MKAVKIVAGLIAVVVIGIVVFLLTFDIGKYKGLIQDQAKAATGREVVIGDIRMAFSLTPTILLQDVSVANAPWGSRPKMVTVKRIEAKAELLPLLSKRVNISKIVLEDGDVLLETNKEGKANWEFDTPKAAPSNSAGGQQSSLNVGGIDGSNLKVVMKDDRTGRESDVGVKSISIRMSGSVQDMIVEQLTLDDATIAQHQGSDILDVAIGKVEMKASGKLADLGIRQLDVSGLKISGKTDGKPLDLQVSKLSIDDKGAVDLKALYNGGEVTAKGTVAAVTAFKSGQKALPAKLSLEGMGLKGDVDVTVDATKTPPMAKGTITIPEIDLAKFAGPATGTPAAGAPAKSGAPAAAPASQRLIPDEPLPWDSLRSVDADVKVSIGTVKLTNGQALTNVVLPIQLEHGRLQVHQASVDFAGGKIGGDVTADAADKAIAIKGGLTGFTAEALAKAYKKVDLIAKGPLDLAVDVRGSGASPHAIASTLSGSIVGGMGESRIRNDALNFVGADIVMQIINAVNPMGNRDPYTVARCAAVNFQITGGIANTQNGVALVTDKMQMVGTGKLDLGQERIDMVVKPTATGGLGIGLGKLVSAVKVQGPIVKPNIGIDSAGTAKALGTLGAAFATGGASLLAQGAADRATAASGGDVCQAARTWNAKKS